MKTRLPTAILSILATLAVSASGRSVTPPVTPVFLEDEIIFATIVATDAPYRADPTGERDATEAINRAMDRVRQLGGGTCYLPAGTYRVEGHLEIPATVTLMGDWERPRPGEPVGGTILHAYAGRGDADGQAFIRVKHPKQGHLKRVAIGYPSQEPGDIVPYPFTIEGNVSHIREITFINSYRGINMADNSGSVVSGIYGTVLETGIATRNSVELCRVYNVEFSPDYWAGAGEPFFPAGAKMDPVHDFMAENLHALRIGKSDGIAIYDVDANPAKVALEAAMEEHEKERMLTSPNKYGLGGVVWKVPGPRTRNGWDAWYFGAHYADLDAIPELPDVTFDFPGPRAPARMSPDSIFNVRDPRFGAVGDGEADDTGAIRAALAAAGEAGGGTVYLPQGQYRLTEPLTVPSGVELRGPLAVGQIRAWFEACSLLVDWQTESGTDAFAAPAAVTLEADAGMRGLMMSHMRNIWEMDDNGELVITPMPYAVRGAGKGVWLQDVTFTNAYLGVDLATHRCDDFVIKDLWATFLREGIRVGGGTTGGTMEIVTVDFGPWHGWKRLPEETERGVRSPYNKWINEHLDLYVFEDCADLDLFSLASFFPEVNVILRDGGADGPRNLEFWLGMFDVSKREGILAEAGDGIDFYGLFLTGGDSGVYNWLEFGPDFAGSLDVYGTTLQPTYYNRPMSEWPTGFAWYPGRSLTAGKPVEASTAPHADRAAEFAVDADPRTYWESRPDQGGELIVDLGAVRDLDRWRLLNHGLYGGHWLNTWTASIHVSDDGERFEQVDRFAGNIVPVVERPLPAGTRGRYIKLDVEKGTSALGFQRARIHQFDVFGPES